MDEPNPGLLICSFQGKSHNKGASPIGCTLGCNVSAMPVHDFPGDGEPDAHAFVGAPAVEPLKGDKDPIQMPFVEADTIILDPDFTQDRLGGSYGCRGIGDLCGG